MAMVAQYKELFDVSATFDSKKAIAVYGEDKAEFWIVENNGTTYYVFDFNDSDKYFTTGSGSKTSAVANSVSATVTAYNTLNLLIGTEKDVITISSDNSGNITTLLDFYLQVLLLYHTSFLKGKGRKPFFFLTHFILQSRKISVGFVYYTLNRIFLRYFL